jgi:phage N-6-adenine-methyltransferase
VTYHDVARSSATAEWATPGWIVDQLAGEFGSFDLDPCATRDNAKAPVYYTRDDDGMSLPWHGRVWLNPPYGRTDSHGRDIGAWMRKAVSEVGLGNATVVVALVPARVDTRWWREACASASLVRILPGRIRWANDQPAPFGNAVLVFGDMKGKHPSASHLRCVICDRVMWKRAGSKTCSAKCRKALSRRQSESGVITSL